MPIMGSASSFIAPAFLRGSGPPPFRLPFPPHVLLLDHETRLSCPPPSPSPSTTKNSRRRSRRLPPHPLLRRAITRHQVSLILTPSCPIVPRDREAFRRRGARFATFATPARTKGDGVWKRSDLVGGKSR